MSSVSDAFTGGGSSSSGVDTSSLFDNASLGSQITGGGDPFAAAGGDNFNTFNDVLNAFGGGGISSANAATVTPAAAAATGGDPTGAAGGTQSSTAPGSTAPAQGGQGGQTGQGGGQGGGQNQQPQYAPKSAIQQLIQAMTGKPQGPTGLINKATAIPTGGVNAPPAPNPALPTLAAGQTGPQSPMQTSTNVLRDAASQAVGAAPAGARIPPGAAGAPSPPPAGTEPGGTRDIQTGLPVGSGAWPVPDPGAPKTDAQGNPITAAGTPAAQTPTPPPRPQQTASTTGGAPTPKTDDQGRQITVQKEGAGAKPLPTKVPLPTKKGGPEPAPEPAVAGPATTQIQRDIAGVSTGNPAALHDLAQAAMMILPLIGMFAGGGRRGHFGGFRGGRFTHGIGGGRGFGGFGGRGHLGGRGMWPYHHPTFGWRMHGYHPGGGWRPMSPQDGQSFGLNPQGGQDGQDPNALDPNKAPPELPDQDIQNPDQAAQRGSGGGPGRALNQVGGSASPDDILATIRQRESGNTYNRAPWQGHDASGAYQFKPGTWQTVAQQSRDPEAQKYREAYLAPPEVQDRMARYALMRYGPNASFTWAASGPMLGKPYPEVAGGNLAAKTHLASTQTQNLPKAASIPTTLPVTSQPNVAAR